MFGTNWIILFVPTFHKLPRSHNHPEPLNLKTTKRLKIASFNLYYYLIHNGLWSKKSKNRFRTQMPKFLREILQNNCLNIFGYNFLVNLTIFLAKKFVWWYTYFGRKVQNNVLWEDKGSVFKNRLKSEFKRRRELLSYIKFEQLIKFFIF